LTSETDRSFGTRLGHAGLAEAFAYWAELAREGTPAYRAFDPIRIPALLPHLQVYRRMPDGGLRIDLAGESVADLIGRNNSGRLLSDILPPQPYAERAVLFERAMVDGMPVAYRSVVAIATREHVLQKRVLMPFVENGPAADLVLAMVVGLRMSLQDFEVGGHSPGLRDVIHARPEDIPGRTRR
jgi:hypothetical protein